LIEAPSTTGSITQNLRTAQHNIREIKRAATAKREAYLTELVEAAENTNEKAKKKLILHLKLAEQNRKCFNLHRHYMKPRSAGGLTRLLIPDPTKEHQRSTIIEPRTMEHHLIEYCKVHFQQAQGSPYTVPSLSDLLQYDSLTPFGATVLNGTADLDNLNLSDPTKLLLCHQRTWLPNNHQRLQSFPFAAMLEGFHKWPERTSTSPSGRHLGIYKSLTKDANKRPAKCKPQTTQMKLQPSKKQKTPEYNGAHVLRIIHQLLTMAVQH